MTNRVWRIQPDGYQMVPSMRVTQDNISQQDGSVLHPRYKTGIVAAMRVNYMISPFGSAEETPACETDLREMHEFLVGCLNSIRSYAGGTDQRLYWTPSGYGDQRLLDALELLTWPEPSREGETVETGVTFSVESPFPYAIDNTQTDTVLAGAATLTNLGNADFYPVFKVHGATSAFTITNTTTGLAIVYDAALPGGTMIPGGHYGEIDCFRATCYQDGVDADLIPGFDPTTTDFFPLVPGANALTISGATADVLWNNAWA